MPCSSKDHWITRTSLGWSGVVLRSTQRGKITAQIKGQWCGMLPRGTQTRKRCADMEAAAPGEDKRHTNGGGSRYIAVTREYQGHKYPRPPHPKSPALPFAPKSFFRHNHPPVCIANSLGLAHCCSSLNSPTPITLYASLILFCTGLGNTITPPHSSHLHSSSCPSLVDGTLYPVGRLPLNW